MTTPRKLSKLLILLVILGVAVFLIDSYWRWSRHYRQEIYPGIRIGEVSLEKKRLSAAQELLTEKTKQIEAAGLKFRSGDKEVIIAAAFSSFDADLSYPALVYQVDKTVRSAFGEKSSHSFLNYLLFRLISKKNRAIPASYHLDETRIKTLLADNFPELEIPAANAYFSLGARSQLVSNPEKIGKEINYDQLFETLRSNLDNLKNEVIIIKTRTKYPEVKQADLNALEDEAKKIIARDTLSLTLEEVEVNLKSGLANTRWEIKPSVLITWVGARRQADGLKLFLDTEKIKQYLQNEISPQIDQEVVRPRFEVKKDKVSNWQVGKNGRQLDIEASTAKIAQEFLADKNEISLIVKELTSNDLTAENSFNIQEIVGIGHSNFSGSPANRRHNIKVGAEAVHGILIKPGEEFSLVKTLGEIDAAAGYLPELVIKGDKTIPEYGGGLCQIGTTIFRSALSTGLPITARQNHSYRVSYYEPAGMDAAVYDPWPDVRFVNDTPNYILIQSRIEGNDLYFDFWGVKDGRQATTTKPVIYNIVKPGPTKIIETSDLAPGEKKCTEHAHNGADTYFDYIVTYPEGSTTTPVQERRFSSHYVPWQEVCLVGAAQSSSTQATTSIATSSPETNN